MEKFLLYNYFFIFILKILNIQSLQFLKTIHLADNNYYMITANNLYYYTDGKTVNQKLLTTFINDQIITTSKESEMIDLSIFEDFSIAHILIVKHYFYGLLNNDYYCITVINELKGYYSEVFTIKYSLAYSYLVLGIIDYTTKKLQLFLIQNQSIECNIKNIFDIGINNVDSININCQLMQSPSKDQVLTCFYQSSNEIIASSFNINTGLTKKIELITSLTKSKINDGGKIIKSILSQDEKKAFVCYINNDNNCYCLTYDITNNEWSDYNTYLNNCILDISSLNIDYSENKKEYVVYCFQSTTKFNIQKLDENFEKKEDEENGYYDLNNKLNTCGEYYLSSLEYESENLNMFVICDDNIKKFEIKHSKVTNLLSTTILSTLPDTTTTLKLLLDTTFFPPLSTSIIHSTISLISSSIIHNFQDYDIIQKETNISKENIINNIETGLNEYDIMQIKTNYSKEYIINNIKTGLKDYNISKIYEIFGEDYNAKISPIQSKINKNITTTIDF